MPECVALLPWGNVIEEFLDAIGVSLEEFCTRMTGGWLFGYIEALQLVGVRAVVFCVSADVDRVRRVVHPPTGATICLLPATRAFRALRRRGVRPFAPTPAASTRSRALPVRAARAGLGSVAGYLSTPPTLLARELRREGCTAILCQEYEYPRFDVCVALGRRLHLPVFATFQGGNWQMSPLEWPLRRLSMRRCAGLIIAPKTESRRVQERYRVPGSKLARIFNPLDLTSWQPQDRLAARAALDLPPQARIAVWHGRIDMQRKGLDVLLRAWDRLCQERARYGEDLRLLVIGTGADAEEFGRLITDLRLEGVHWTNEYLLDRNRMRQYLSAADVYAFSSRHEGFPLAPIEAMACGLPVVASDAPGIPDIFEGGEEAGGLVVSRGDAVALARGLGRLFDDPAYCRRLGVNARRRAHASFSLAAVGEQLRSALFGSEGAEPANLPLNATSIDV